MSDDRLAPGRRVGPYTIERELGRGGMGAVYVARHAQLGRVVALKVLGGGRSAGAQQALRFAREARAAARLRHENIVTIHDAGEVEGLRYLAMDLIEGRSLADRLRTDGPLPPLEAARVALALARALAHAHAEGVVHRDVKPDNVLLATDGRPMLADFGLARDLQEIGGGLTRTGEVLGTPAFMSPEQADGKAGQVDARADVYALGATLFAMLTGEPPFAAASLPSLVVKLLGDPAPAPSSRRAGVPAALDAVVLRCLAKEPAARHPSADALAAALEDVLAARARSRAPLLVALVIAGAVVAAALAVAIVMGREPSPPTKVEAPAPPASPPAATPSTPSTPSTPAPAAERWRWRRIPRAAVWPSARATPLCWDEREKRLLLVGGFVGRPNLATERDVWTLVAERWARAGVLPATRVHDHALAADDRGRVVLHGGEGRVADQLGALDAWEARGEVVEEWTPVDAGPGPSRRMRHAVVWAHERRAFLLLGGIADNGPDALTGPRLDDLWALTDAGWKPQRGRGPPARSSAAVAWVGSGRSGRLIVHGGCGDGGLVRSDLWAWDGSTWTQLAPEGGPGPRTQAGFATDGSRCFLFGGLVRTTPGPASLGDGELWMLEGARWTRAELAGDERPEPRARAGLAWDREGSRLVLFGGVRPSPDHPSYHGEALDDLWELRAER